MSGYRMSGRRMSTATAAWMAGRQGIRGYGHATKGDRGRETDKFFTKHVSLL